VGVADTGNEGDSGGESDGDPIGEDVGDDGADDVGGDAAGDPCDPNPCLNDGACAPGGTGYVCDCTAWYTGATCETDIDECAQDNGGCGDALFWTCENIEGADPACADIDECATDNGGCGDPGFWTCENIEGAAPVCADIDECLADNGGCGDPVFWTCENQEGAAPVCADVDECAQDNGGCGDPVFWTCENQEGAAPVCADVDECAQDNGGCGDPVFWLCENVEGLAPVCSDVDECAVDNGGCGDPVFWTCINIEGSAPVCSDMDECAENNGGCGDPQYWTCANVEGDDPLCADIDECAQDNGGCGEPRHWNCENVEGAEPRCLDVDECGQDNGDCGDARLWTCENVEGDDPICTDINECAQDNGDCGDARYWTCENQVGDVPLCLDIDECLVENGGCGNPLQWRCVNQRGADPLCEARTDCGGVPLEDCSDVAVCVLRNGLEMCACPEGFEGNGLICYRAPADFDEVIDPLLFSTTEIDFDAAGNTYLAEYISGRDDAYRIDPEGEVTNYIGLSNWNLGFVEPSADGTVVAAAYSYSGAPGVAIVDEENRLSVAVPGGTSTCGDWGFGAYRFCGPVDPAWGYDGFFYAGNLSARGVVDRFDAEGNTAPVTTIDDYITTLEGYRDGRLYVGAGNSVYLVDTVNEDHTLLATFEQGVVNLAAWESGGELYVETRGGSIWVVDDVTGDAELFLSDLVGENLITIGEDGILYRMVWGIDAQSHIDRYRVAAPCAPCDDGTLCRDADDCASGVCSDNTCLPPTCTDGVRNGDEQGVDCGAEACFACTCSNGELDANETDVDCGGTCGPCLGAAMCQEDADCFGRCVDSRCTDTCEDRENVNLIGGGTGFSSPITSHPAPRAFDGVLTTFAWMLGGENALENSVHLGYDFGAPVVVNRLRINQHYSNECYFLTAVLLQSSNDGEGWTDRGRAAGLSTGGGDELHFNDRRFENRTPARYWRLLADSNTQRCGNPDVWIVRELELIGCVLD
jgi:hypothetical protein